MDITMNNSRENFVNSRNNGYSQKNEYPIPTLITTSFNQNRSSNTHNLILVHNIHNPNSSNKVVM